MVVLRELEVPFGDWVEVAIDKCREDSLDIGLLPPVTEALALDSSGIRDNVRTVGVAIAQPM